MMTWTRNKWVGEWKQHGLRIMQYLFLIALALASALTHAAQHWV